MPSQPKDTSTALILDAHAEIYRDRLRAEFPALQFLLAHDVSELPRDIAAADVLISFGLGLRDDFFRRATRLQWVQCLATGVDHLLGQPALRRETLPTAYYINAGRGQTVDEAALIAALRENRIAGAGLDVFQTEPLPADSPFWGLPNAFILPHLDSYCVEYEELILPLIIENMRLFLTGRLDEMHNIIER